MCDIGTRIDIQIKETIESSELDSHKFVHQFCDNTGVCCTKMVFSTNGVMSVGYS